MGWDGWMDEWMDGWMDGMDVMDRWYGMKQMNRM